MAMRVTSCIILLVAVFIVVGCEGPVESEIRSLDVHVRGDRPFYYEGSWDNYEKKFLVDSTYVNDLGYRMEVKESGSPPSGSSLRVYAKSQEPGGHVIATVQLTHPRWKGKDVLFHQTKESYSGAVEITCVIP
jgi:hypothetical protein